MKPLAGTHHLGGKLSLSSRAFSSRRRLLAARLFVRQRRVCQPRQ